jgi:Protein of unknown function (DUF3370)
MLVFLPLPLAQVPPAQELVQPQSVRSLPGHLNQVPVFNSNSPELVKTEGILLSTFPPAGKHEPAAHLNFPFSGEFDVFAHHAFQAITDDLTSLYLGIIVYNPGDRPITLQTLQAASYVSQPDAPFVQLAPVLDNADGRFYAGPGDRVMSDILRGKRQTDFPPTLTIPPHEYRMLMNLPIPVRTLTPPLNGRSTLMRLRSNGTVYLASLALLARQNPDGSERPPTLEEWRSLLENGSLSSVRDVYGRVAGVARGTLWQANLTDANRPDLAIPSPGSAFSYGLSTLARGRLGSGQSQTAPLLVRYPDTAYEAHGNYGIEYDLSLPLHNPTDRPQTVTLTVQTPIKEDTLSENGLRFFNPLPAQTYFRGTVRFRYPDDRHLPQTRYFHLVQRRGQQGEPLVTLVMPPGDRRLVEFTFLYPPDATPPQVLTVQTQAD